MCCVAIDVAVDAKLSSVVRTDRVCAKHRICTARSAAWMPSFSCVARNVIFRRP